MTLADRVDAYARSPFGQRFPASRLWLTEEKGLPVAYGRWLIGNNYRRRAGYHGEYPPGLVARVMVLFPDVPVRQVLHVFSGSLPPGPYTRCDRNPTNGAELVCDVLELPRRTPRCWRLAMADPPYSSEDARRYGTRMVHRGRVVRALARVVVAGGHLAWLDEMWPMHSLTQWRTVMRISIVTSTNRRLRDVSVFERRAA